jgi:hypothetical protein
MEATTESARPVIQQQSIIRMTGQRQAARTIMTAQYVQAVIRMPEQEQQMTASEIMRAQ